MVFLDSDVFRGGAGIVRLHEHVQSVTDRRRPISVAEPRGGDLLELAEELRQAAGELER